MKAYENMHMHGSIWEKGVAVFVFDRISDLPVIAEAWSQQISWGDVETSTYNSNFEWSHWCVFSTSGVGRTSSQELLHQRFVRLAGLCWISPPLRSGGCVFLTFVKSKRESPLSFERLDRGSSHLTRCLPRSFLR